MHRSSDLTDEPSRLKQFAWEQWENQPFAILFRPGTYGLERYVVKRYVEHVLAQSERWKQLSPYFPSTSPSLRAYTMTSYEIELMQKILDYHLNDTLHLRISSASDQLIEYDDLLDFIRRVQDLSRTNASSNSRPIPVKKTGIPSIPSIHSSYVLPPSAKSLMQSSSQATTSKINPVKSILAKPPVTSIMNMSTAQLNKPSNSTITPTTVNGHHTSQSTNNSSSRSASNIQVKPNLISPPINVDSTYPTPPPSSNQSGPSIPSELCPNSLYNARIEGSGWVQINNVFLPFIIKNRQRLVPYQVLVSCKILEVDELRPTLTHATTADITLMNRMIRDCKINNEEIVENAPLINVYHILIALRGGSLYITYRTVPFVCSSNHSYISLNDVLSIYPYLQSQLKPLARVPRTHELDFLQLVQMYYDEKELPSDTLLIDMEDLNQTQIIPSKNMTLIEHHGREKSKLEQQIALLINSSSSSSSSSNVNKRKNSESHENKQQQQQQQPPPPQQKPKTSSNHYPPSPPVVIRPPTGYFPTQQAPASSTFTPQYQPNHWLSSNYGKRGRTGWQ